MVEEVTGNKKGGGGGGEGMEKSLPTCLYSSE